MSVRIIILDPLDLVVRRFQLGVRNYDDMHVAPLLQPVDLFTFFVEQIGCALDRYLGQYFAGIVFQCLVFEQA